MVMPPRLTVHSESVEVKYAQSVAILRIGTEKSTYSNLRKVVCNQIQSPLGFATLDKAAALGLATATPMTDLRQYINSDFGFNDLEI